MVRRENTVAVSGGVTVLPVRIDPTLPHIVRSAQDLLAEPAPFTSARSGDDLSFADRPAVAVLPFRAADDAAQLARELTDDLIAAISAWRIYPVISRHSVFELRATATDARAIGRLLGARYLVGGRVRRATGTVRVTAELVDVETGDMLATETTDFATDAAINDIVLAIARPLGDEVVKRPRRDPHRSQPVRP